MREEDRKLIDKLESRRLRALYEGRTEDAQRLAEWSLGLIFGFASRRETGGSPTGPPVDRDLARGRIRSRAGRRRTGPTRRL